MTAKILVMAGMAVMGWASAAQAAIENDTRDTAAGPVELGVAYTHDTAQAENDASPYYFGEIWGGAWYRFEAPVDGRYRFSFSQLDSCGAAEMYWPGDEWPTYANSFCRGEPWRFELDLAAGTSYEAVIGTYPSYWTSTATFQVDRIVPPENDTAARAEVIPSVPGSVDGDSTSATGDGSPCGYWYDDAVWYSFMAPRDGRFHASVQGNGMSGYIHVTVATGTPDALSAVACPSWANWDSGGTSGFDVTAGNTYYVMVASYYEGWGYQGAFTLTIDEALDVTAFAVTGGTVNTRTGVPTLSGVVSCNKDANVNIWGNARQKIDRRTYANAEFSGNVACVAGQSVAWTARAHWNDRPFVSGTVTANVSADASSCDERACEGDSASSSATIRLRSAR